MAWEAVQAKRADLRAGAAEVSDIPFQRLPALKADLNGWDDATLAATIEKSISPAIGTPGVFVKSLNTGASMSVGADRVFPTASLFKVPILVELLRQQGLGMHDMSTRITLQQKHWADGAGVLQARIGEQFTVRELVDYMIDVSDNVAALALLDLVGTDNVNLTLQANGFVKTRLRIGQTSRDWGGQPGENTTTAREMGTLFEMIANGKLLNEQGTRVALQLLSQKQQVSWLPNLLPPDVKVAHKSGELVNLRHDAGIVFTPRNQFVVVVLTSDLADHEEAARSISRIAKAAYDYFEFGKKQ